jgi:O-antigen/teichoic acid export membrane protein
VRTNIGKFVKSILRTDTLRQSAITFSGTFVNGVLGVAFYILSARFLGPSSYGVMMLSVATLTLVSDIADLGTNTGLVRFVSEHIKNDKDKAYRFLKLGLEVKIVLLIVFLVLGLLISPFLAEKIFLKSEMTNYLRIAFLGVGSMLLFTFVISALQSLQKFWVWSGVQVGANMARLIFLLVLFLLGSLDTSSNLVIYILSPLLGFILGMFFIGVDFLKVKGESRISKEFFSYNKWVALSSLVSAFGARIDTFITGRLLTSFDLGIYSAANQLVQIVPQIVVAVSTVIAPKMAAMGTMEDFISYLKKVQAFVSALVFAGALSIPFIIFIVPFLFGEQYLSVIPVFVVLMFAMLIFLFSVPIHVSIFYYFSRPDVFLWLGLIHLSLVSITSWRLIPIFGSVGAGWAVLLGQVVNFTIPLVWIIKKIGWKSLVRYV